MKLIISAVLTICALILALNMLPSNQPEHKEVPKVELQRSSTHEQQTSPAATPTPPPSTKSSTALRWDVLQGLDYKTGKPNKDVKQVLKKTIKIPGFVVPLDLNAQNAKEFLLVPTYGACIHTPPPPANQMILVKMKQGFAPKREDGPVWVEGPLDLFKTETPWGKAGYRIIADKTTPYKGGY